LKDFKVLDHKADGKFANNLRSLISATRAYHLLVEVTHHLDALELHNQPESQFFQPVIDYALVTYAAIFNSCNAKHDGVGKYNIGQVHTSDTARFLHDVIISYRNKEVAHLTDFSRKTILLTSVETREVIIRGELTRDRFCNFCQTNSQMWHIFLGHVKDTRDWFKEEANRLRSEISVELSKKHHTCFECLSDAPKLPDAVERIIQLVRVYPQSNPSPH
jgi:hypothetical protein